MKWKALKKKSASKAGSNPFSLVPMSGVIGWITGTYTLTGTNVFLDDGGRSFTVAISEKQYDFYDFVPNQDL
ncbi:MAG: hypothetical protein IKH57_27255 [Clostridia bacterium]|nr:hypothetical protein [Lachnospiraceae bacterium]MBR3020723.1 hypothetical protein [Clostridia bacterium]